MLYLLWTAINGTALIYFFAACATAARAVWAKVGLLPLLVVVFGLVSFHGSSSESATQAPHPARQVWAGASERRYIKLEDYHLAAIELSVTYATPDSGQVIFSNTSLTGLKMGQSWHPSATRITIKNHQLAYYVEGFLDWKLLGTTVYREPKQLTGVAQL